MQNLQNKTHANYRSYHYEPIKAVLTIRTNSILHGTFVANVVREVEANLVTLANNKPKWR
jgi:hypothetical protein